MRQLDDVLNNISVKIEKADELLTEISCDVGDVRAYFDLCDFSVDTLQDWLDDWDSLSHKIGLMLTDFDTFAFDGDSIREADEEENESPK